MPYSKLGLDADKNPIEVNSSDRIQHMYIIGSPGAGKSTLMENLVLADINQQLGVCVIDPHGLLIDNIIAKVTRRLDEVVLLDLTNTDFIFGINAYECNDPKNDQEVQRTVDRVLNIWKKLFGVNDKDTPLITEYMRACAFTIIPNGYTMAEIPLLLQEKWFRDKLVPQVREKITRRFWDNFEQGEKSHSRYHLEKVEAVLRRLTPFLQTVVENLVGQSKSTINFVRLMDERKIVLIKLDKNAEEVSNLIGSIFVELIRTGAFTRNASKPPMHFYFDEWDRFATSSFRSLWTESRKYGVAITAAHQDRSKLHAEVPELLRTTLSAWTTVVFQISPPDSDEMVGKFSDEAERPKPEEIGRRKKQTIVLNPVQYLLNNKGGHPNRVINDFVINFLAKLEQICLTKHDNTILLELSSLLYKAMTTQSVAVVPQDLFVQFFIKYGQELLQSSAFGWLDYTHPVYQGIQITISMQQNYNYLSQCFDDVYMQPQNGAQTSNTLFGQMNTVLIEAYTAWYNRFSSLRFPLNPRNIADTYTPAIHQQVMKILLDLRKVIDILVKQPLKADGMEDEIITRPGQQKTRSERQAEIKDELSKLPVLTARVRLKEYPPNLKTSVCHCCGKVDTLAAYPAFCSSCGVHTQPEYKITVQPVPITMSPHAITARLTAITTQNLADGYLREKKAVEDEIKRRQEVPVVQNTANVNQPPTPRKRVINP